MTKVIELNQNEPLYKLVAVVFYLLKENYVLFNNQINKYTFEHFSKVSKKNYNKAFVIQNIDNTVFRIHYRFSFLGMNELIIRYNKSHLNIKNINKTHKCITTIHNNLESKLNLKSDLTDDNNLIPEWQYKLLDDTFAKFKFYEEHNRQICSFLVNIFKYNSYSEATSTQLDFSANTFYKFKPILNIMDDNFDKLYNQPRDKYLNFIDFLIEFKKDKSTIKTINIKNIKIISLHHSILIQLGKFTIFSESMLKKFKFIDHPGLYLALYFINDPKKVQNKFFKMKLEAI